MRGNPITALTFAAILFLCLSTGAIGDSLLYPSPGVRSTHGATTNFGTQPNISGRRDVYRNAHKSHSYNRRPRQSSNYFGNDESSVLYPQPGAAGKRIGERHRGRSYNRHNQWHYDRNQARGAQGRDVLPRDRLVEPQARPTQGVGPRTRSQRLRHGGQGYHRQRSRRTAERY